MNNQNESKEDWGLLRRISLYKMNGFDVRRPDNKTVIFEQIRADNGYILTKKELHERAREIFPDKRINIIPLTYYLDLDFIDPEWIKEQMEELNIKQSDIARQTGFNKSSVSMYLSGKIGLTKAMKALFYYYFLTFRLNRDLRHKEG